MACEKNCDRLISQNSCAAGSSILPCILGGVYPSTHHARTRMMPIKVARLINHAARVSPTPRPLLLGHRRRVDSLVGARRRIAAASAAPHSAMTRHATLSGIQKALRELIRVDRNELAVASMANSEDDLAGARPPPTKSAPSSLQAPTRPAKRRGLGIDIPGTSTAFGCRLWHASPVRVTVANVASPFSSDD